MTAVRPRAATRHRDPFDALRLADERRRAASRLRRRASVPTAHRDPRTAPTCRPTLTNDAHHAPLPQARTRHDRRRTSSSATPRPRSTSTATRSARSRPSARRRRRAGRPRRDHRSGHGVAGRRVPRDRRARPRDAWRCHVHVPARRCPTSTPRFARAVEPAPRACVQPADQFHGNRTADVRDPFGHRWTFTAPIRVCPTPRRDAAAAGQGLRSCTRARRGGSARRGRSRSQIKHHEHGRPLLLHAAGRDLAKAQAFFGAVLGWQFDDPTSGHIENISAPPGAVHAGDDAPGARLWFVVDDIHAAVATVRELGGTADEPVHYDSGWSADCTDDQGTCSASACPSAAYSR